MTKGHKGHEHGHMGKMAADGHPFKEHRARGGAMKEPEIGGVPEIGGKPEKAEDKAPLSARRRGGKVKEENEKKERRHEKRKRGGKVHGKHPGHRLDKRARGGRMTPSSPFSGADGADLSYAKGDIASKSEAVGRDKT